MAKSLSFTDIGKSCPSREFLTLQICILMLQAKIEFSGNFQNLQYFVRLFACVRYASLSNFLGRHILWGFFSFIFLNFPYYLLERIAERL